MSDGELTVIWIQKGRNVSRNFNSGTPAPTEAGAAVTTPLPRETRTTHPDRNEGVGSAQVCVRALYPPALEFAKAGCRDEHTRTVIKL